MNLFRKVLGINDEFDQEFEDCSISREFFIKFISESLEYNIWIVIGGPLLATNIIIAQLTVIVNSLY